jgi:hypothetical protein
VSAEPHWLQKREPARLGCPHFEQTIDNAAPQEPQNFAVSALSAWQLGHRMPYDLMAFSPVTAGIAVAV